jgi:hypothetical protein
MRKLRAIAAVLLLSSMTVWAQSAPATNDAKPDEHHAACKRDKDGNMECCKKDKDGKMTHAGDCCKSGACARMKKDEKKS